MGFESTGLNECEPACIFDEVTLTEEDEDVEGNLKAGMRVLLPCKGCGMPPLEQLEWFDYTLDTTQKAFDRLVVERDMPLYHWAPSSRRKQIIRYGLRPSMRPTTHAGDLGKWRAPYVCLGDDPAWAWALSGDQAGAPNGEWDLWQVYASKVDEGHIMPADFANGIHEIRTMNRIFKRHLKLVAGRVKE